MKRIQLELYLGKQIKGVRRIWYVTSDEVNDSVGRIEFAFTDGSAIVFDAGPDGEALAISDEEWIDPFSPPLSPENERYVATSGKWTAFDVSDRPPYSSLVGAVVEGLEPHMNPTGKIIGVTLVAGESTVRADVEADEMYVDVL